jgi:hypothetical protein
VVDVDPAREQAVQVIQVNDDSLELSRFDIRVTVTTDEKSFVDVFSGKVSSRSAIIAGKIYVHGFAFRELKQFSAAFDSERTKRLEFFRQRSMGSSQPIAVSTLPTWQLGLRRIGIAVSQADCTEFGHTRLRQGLWFGIRSFSSTSLSLFRLYNSGASILKSYPSLSLQIVSRNRFQVNSHPLSRLSSLHSQPQPRMQEQAPQKSSPSQSAVSEVTELFLNQNSSAETNLSALMCNF